MANTKYRYGFNGKENDNEVKGEGNQQDYGMRIYDPRLGKFLSVDPIEDEYPELTPYQFASNTPIQSIDLDGLEAVPITPIVNFLSWLFGDDLDEINEGQKNINEGIQQQIDGPERGAEYSEIANDKNSDYTVEQSIELRKMDGKLRTWKGVVQIGEGINSIGGKGEAIVTVGLVSTNALSKVGGKYVGKAIIKKTATEETAKVIEKKTISSKSMTSTWVKDGKVSPGLVKKYNKLNKIERPYLKFTPAGKKVVKDINKEINGGNMKCVGCGTTATPAPKSKSGVKPSANEAHVDHVERRRTGGSGTPVNGDVRCQNCNVIEKH